MRLYSPREVTLVRRTAALAAEGINLNGIGRILALETRWRRCALKSTACEAVPPPIPPRAVLGRAPDVVIADSPTASSERSLYCAEPVALIAS